MLGHAFRQINNTGLYIIAFYFAFEVGYRFYVEIFLVTKNPAYLLRISLTYLRKFC